MSNSKEITTPKAFSQALKFFENKTKVLEGSFLNRSVKIPGVEEGHVSRLIKQIEGSNAEPSRINLPMKRNGKKSTEFSSNVAKYLLYKKIPSNCLPEYHSSYLRRKLIEEERKISEEAKAAMDLALYGERRCSVSTMATDEFGTSGEDQASSAESWPSEKTIDEYFQGRGSYHDDDDGLESERDSYHDDDDSLCSLISARDLAALL